MGRHPERKPEDVAAAILKADGLVTLAAKSLRLAPVTVYEYINKYPVCKTALEDARTGMGDAAESKLFNNVRQGDQRAVEFYLKTIHKSRGYVERQELAGVEDRPIAVSINRIVARPAMPVGEIEEPQ